jgi:uncharacterized repeat protein (TIGR01451 family)
MGQVTQNNDLYTWTIPVTNNGGFNSTENVVTDPLPDGIKYLNAYTIPANVGTITYNTGTKTVTWDIGLLTVGQEVTLKINTKIIDVTEAPFVNEATIEGSLVDPDPDNNTFTETVTVTTCPPSANAVNDPNSCYCYDVTTNDTPCTHGVTTYELIEDSLVNIDEDFIDTWDEETGSGNIAQFIIDKFLEASFQYKIICTPTGESPLDTSGPATVTFEPFFHSTQVFPAAMVMERKFVITIAAFADDENPTDAEVLTWASNIVNIPIIRRDGSIIIYNRPSVANNLLNPEYVWQVTNLEAGTNITRIEEPVRDYYTPIAANIPGEPGSVDNELDLDDFFTSTCPGTTTYVVYTNSWFLNKSITGSIFEYDIDIDIPAGENSIIIVPTCNP